MIKQPKFALRLLVLGALGGCASSAPQPTLAEHQRVVDYEAELEDAEVACANGAPTREESRACRAAAKARINAKYGRDGGT